MADTMVLASDPLILHICSHRSLDQAIFHFSAQILTFLLKEIIVRDLQKLVRVFLKVIIWVTFDSCEASNYFSLKSFRIL